MGKFTSRITGIPRETSQLKQRIYWRSISLDLWRSKFLNLLAVGPHKTSEKKIQFAQGAGMNFTAFFSSTNLGFATKAQKIHGK